MLSMNKEKRPQPEETAPATDNIFQFEQHRGVRFVLDQVYTFFSACELMSLPHDNPFAFFCALEHLLKNPKQCCWDGEAANIKEYLTLPLGVLLLYACYGNALFGLSSVVSDSCIDRLRALPSLRVIRAELERCNAKEILCRLTAREEQQYIYRLYPEVIQYNEDNSYFSFRNGVCMLKIVGNPTEVPDALVSDLYRLFLSYYAKMHGGICGISIDAKLPKQQEALLKHMQGLLELRALENTILQAPIETVEQLSDAAKELAALLKRYSSLGQKVNDCIAQPCAELIKFSEQLNDDDSNTSERLNSKKAQDAALAGLTHALSNYPPRQMKLLQERMKTLLHSYADNITYRFFNSAYEEISCNLTTLSLSPVYIWRLFVLHADSLYQQKSYLISEGAEKSANPCALKQPADFSLNALLHAKAYSLQSEERTSDRITACKCELYDRLVEYFDRNPIKGIPVEDLKSDPFIPINKRICQQLLQRHLLANLCLYTNVGITGSTLTHQVPLYRLFSTLYDALHSMDSDLWKQMPHSQPFSVLLEQADEFYQTKKSSNAALTFLRESKGQKPIARKENLSLKECVDIVRISLIDRADSLTAQRFEARIDSYIREHKVLCDYAEQSTEKHELLRFTIYRMTLERFAHLLSVSLMEQFMLLFNQWFSKVDISSMWDTFFGEHPEHFFWKTIADPILIGPLTVYGRILLQVSSTAGRLPTPQELDNRSGFALFSGNIPENGHNYLSNLKEHHVLAAYQLSAPDADWAIECSKAARLAQQSGFSGIVLPIYVLDRNTAGDAIDAKDIHKALFAQYHERYTPAIRNACADCGKDFAIFTCICCNDFEQSTLNALDVASFWLAQSGAHAVIVRYASVLSSHALTHIESLTRRLSVPLFLQSPSLSMEQQSRLLTRSAIFGFEEELALS